MTFSKEPKFYGATTVGERGQVVIPAEARKAMKIKDGDKLLVFSPDGNLIMLVKLSELQKFTSRLNTRLKSLKKIIAK